MPERTKNHPVMQDLSDPTSLISKAFARMTPPAGPFDRIGSWTLEYHDISAFSLTQVQGHVSLNREVDGMEHIVSHRTCPDGYRFYTVADLECGADTLLTPSSWTVESKVARTPDGPPYLGSGKTEQAFVESERLVIKNRNDSQVIPLSGAYACKWCLPSIAGVLPRREQEAISFTLVDEYDEPCPNQLLEFTGTHEVGTKSGPTTIHTYQHTGTATMPGVFYADDAGRVLFYLAGMQLLALQSVNDQSTGYLNS